MRRFLPYNTKLKHRASNLRHTMTQPEQKLWRGFLQAHHPRFRRQRMIEQFVEIDGESHFTKEGKAKDKERTAVLEGLGLYVLRFKNDEVMKEFEGVCHRISKVLASRAKVGPSSVPPVRGEDRREFLNIKEGYHDVLSANEDHDNLPNINEDHRDLLKTEREEMESSTDIVEDRNSLPISEGQERVKAQPTTSSREKQ